MSLFRWLVVLLLAMPVTGALADTECDILCDEDWWDSASIDDVKFAIENGKQLDVSDENGFTPLHFALIAGKELDYIKLLLENGADIESQTTYGTPLHIALQKNLDKNIVTYLLQEGADVKARSKNEVTPLHSASAYVSDPEIISLLLSNGADLKAKTTIGITPLHAAIINPEPEITDLLLRSGADPNALADHGMSPLHFAAKFNSNPKITDLLLRNNADPTALNHSGLSPLHFAATFNSNPKITDLLLHNNADPNALENEGWSPLHFAAAINSNPKIVDLLLQQGANINARVEEGRIPLDIEAHPACLFRYEATGLTPLHLAGINSNPDVITSLLDHDIDVNIKDYESRTPLHVAVAYKRIFTLCPYFDYDEDDNNVKTVSTLLENKADPNAVDDLGCPALFYAQYHDTASGVEDLLVKHGAKANNYSYPLCVLKNLPTDTLIFIYSSLSAML